MSELNHEIQRLEKAIKKLEKANAKWPDPDRTALIARNKQQLEALTEQTENTKFHAS